jgi:peptidyl-prolyl cis-trans isomerase D
MLNVFRENLRHLKWILLAVVFSFILTIFAVWGGGLSRVDSGRAGETPWAARVDGRVITIQAFQREARNVEATYRQILGAQFDPQRSFLRIGQTAINRLVDEELIAGEARKAGLLVSGPEIAEAIMRDPSLQENGVFIGRERYQRLYRSNPNFFEEYERGVGRQLLIDKVRSLLESSVSVSEAEVRDAARRQNDKISVQYFRIDSSRLPSTPPTDAAVSEYYRAHSADYPSGEGRSGRYVMWDLQKIAGRTDVPEAEIRSQYLQDQKTKYTLPDRRRASHILVKIPRDAPPEQVQAAETKIKKALSRVKGGEAFDKVAREVSEDASAASGGDLGLFSREQMIGEFSDAAWKLKVGEISEPVRTPFGFHLIRLTDIQAGKELSLEEARPQILTGLKNARARAEAERQAGDFAAKVSRPGADFAKTAADSGLVSQAFEGVHAGEAIAGLGIQPEITNRLSAMKPGEVSAPLAVATGEVVIQYLSATPSAPLPLEAIRERVRADALKEIQVQAARKLFEGAGGGGDFGATARRLKAELKTADSVPRGGPLADLGGDPSLLDRLFALKPGEILGPVATSTGVAVIHLVSHPDPADAAESQKETVRSSLLMNKRDRLFRAYLERLRAAHPPEINSALVDQIDRS